MANGPDPARGKATRDIAAERAGFGGRETYRKAGKVVDEGAPELVEAMNAGIDNYWKRTNFERFT